MEAHGTLEARFDLTEQDLIAWYRADVWNHPAHRRGRRVLLCGIVAVVILCMTPALFMGSPLMGFHYGVIVVGVGLVAALPFWWRGAAARVIRQWLPPVESKGVLGAFYLQIAQDGLTVERPLSKMWFGWELVTDIKRVDEYLVFTASETTVIIPQRALGGDAGAERFLQAARTFRSLAPSFVGKCPNCGYDLRNVAREGCPECGWQRTEG